MKNVRFCNIVLIIFLIGVTSCKKMDHGYKQYVVPGGVIYPAKVVNAIAYPGNYRIKIAWPRGQDPKVTKARIYWDFNADSVEIKIPPVSENRDTLDITIEGLSEKSYSFIIRTYDKEGNVSVPVELISDVYGDLYKSTLLNRPIDLSTMEVKNEAVISWGVADVTNGAFATEIKYTDTLGVSKVLRTSVDVDETVISDILEGGYFEYRTLFLPDSLSIDTFYSDYVETKVPRYEELIPKNTWQVFPLPGDFYQYNASYPVTRVWDGNTTDGANIFLVQGSDPALNQPNWFTVDMGFKAIFSRVALFQRPHGTVPFQGYWPKKFSIWGSNNPDSDGGWDNWNLLGTFTYTSSEFSETFRFVNNEEPYQYFRFEMLENYGASGYQYQLTELTFWGDVAP